MGTTTQCFEMWMYGEESNGMEVENLGAFTLQPTTIVTQAEMRYMPA